VAVLCQRVALAQDTVQARLPASPAPSHKPSRPHRSGLWGELGFGPGYVRIGCSGCTDVIGANGGTSYVRIGGVLSDHALIGVELFSFLDKGFGFSAQDSSTTAETGTLAVIILWYPGSHGLFFKGGVGAAYGAFSIPQDTAGVVTADTSNGGGIGLTFGLGWDTPISRKFAFTGNAAVFVTAVGDVVFPGRRVDDVIATMYQLSIGFTFR
jgi:hypothetical protein